MADCKTSNYPALCPAACKERLFARASLQTRLYLSILFHVCAHFSKLPNRPNASESFPLFLHFHRYKHTPSPPAVKQLLLGHKNFFLFFFFPPTPCDCLLPPSPPPLLHTAASHRVLLKYLQLCRREPQTDCNHRITVFSLFSRLSPPHWKKKEENLAKIPVKQTDSGFAEGKTRCGNTRVTLIRN